MLAALILGAASIATYLSVERRSSPSDLGPLYNSAYGSTGITFGVNRGRPFSWAWTTLNNSSSTPVVIRSVVLVDPSPGLRLLRVQAFPGTFRPRVLVNTPSYPPRIVPPHAAVVPDGPVPFRDAVGLTIPPSSSPLGGVVLLFELQVSGSGPFHAAAVRVAYTNGTDSFTATYPDALTVCVPRKADCAGPPIGSTPIVGTSGGA